MKIKSLNIKNFKSIVGITIDDPSNFSVFVGPNASGKSNILEAIELMVFAEGKTHQQIFNVFGDYDDIINRNQIRKYFDNLISFILTLECNNKTPRISISIGEKGREWPLIEDVKDHDITSDMIFNDENLFSNFFSNFQRIFINNRSESRIKYKTDKYLDFYTSNLTLVLGRLLGENNMEDILELLTMFIPGLDKIQVSMNSLSGEQSLLVYDKNYKRPFTKNLISDGTYNILALITAVLQTDKPQFLLIEEPENGLNPKAIKELVHFFREQCEEKGHFIWLASHSQTLVSELKPEELILVDKIKGETKIKQFKDINLHGMKLDEAWLSNVLGGGLPW